MRAILLSRKDFKRSAADEAAGRPPVDDARWREVATVHLTPHALLHLLRLTPHTLHNTPHASHLFTPYASHLAPRTLRATCHPPPATYPLLTGTRCATCTKLRRCCASGGRSNAAALGWWTQSLQSRRTRAESLCACRVSLSYIGRKTESATHTRPFSNAVLLVSHVITRVYCTRSLLSTTSAYTVECTGYSSAAASAVR